MVLYEVVLTQRGKAEIQAVYHLRKNVKRDAIASLFAVETNG